MVDKKKMNAIMDSLIEAVSVPTPPGTVRGNQLHEITTVIPPNDTLRLVDERLGLEHGTTFKTIRCAGDPTVLNEALAKAGLPLSFVDFGTLPTDQRPAWQRLMQELGVDEEHGLVRELPVTDQTIDT